MAREDLLRDFSKRLKMALEISGNARMTQKEIAEKLGITPPSVNAWFMGKNFPEVEYLVKMCDWLNVDMLWLVTGKHSANSHSIEAAWNQCSHDQRAQFLAKITQVNISQPVEP